MNTKVSFLTVALLLVLTAAAFAMDEKIIYTTTGEKYTGTILSRDDKFVSIRVKGSTVRIPVTIIDKINDYVDEAKLQLLVVHDEKLAKRLHEELRYGADFTELVKKYSEDLSFFNDGKTEFVDRTHLPGGVANLAFRLPKDRYTSPIKAEDAFYIVKILEIRKIEREETKAEKPETPKGQGNSKNGEKPEEPAPAEENTPVRIAVLPIEEKTREARVESLGVDIQELLSSEISQTTGLDAFVPETDKEETKDFTITGEVAKSGPAYSVQFVLKDPKGKELYTSDRLTAVCPGENADDLVKAVRQLAEALVREIKRPR
jgi:hypothetical protein